MKLLAWVRRDCKISLNPYVTGPTLPPPNAYLLITPIMSVTAAVSDPSVSTLDDLLDRDHVVERITELFLATDRKDWPRVEACFAPEVEFDMGSVGAGPMSSKRPREIVAGWQAGLASLEHVHHQAANFVVRVKGDRADAFCYGIAYHFKTRKDGRNTRVFVGSYDYRLVRDRTAPSPTWLISAMRFTLKFIDGNPALEAE